MPKYLGSYSFKMAAKTKMAAKFMNILNAIIIKEIFLRNILKSRSFKTDHILLKKIPNLIYVTVLARVRLTKMAEKQNGRQNI